MHERMIGRADLLNALRLSDRLPGKASPDHLAGMLGFRRTTDESWTAPGPDNDSERDQALGTATSTVTPAPTHQRPPLATSMWMLTELRRFDLHPPKDEETPTSHFSGEEAKSRPLRDEDGLPRCAEPLPALPLVERHRLWPALRRSLSEERHHGVDVPALVRSLARAHLPSSLPLRRDRRWVNDILVVWDTSVRLTPYQADFEMILSEVGARHGGAGLRLWRLHGQPETGFDCTAVHAGGLVLVLSDLGNLAADEGLRAGWRRMLHACRAQGAQVVAWLPHGERLIDGEAVGLGAMHCLVPRSVRRGSVRRGATTAAIRGERQRLVDLRELLLVRASVCIQLEVALLRRLRKTDAALLAEPGVEAMAWTHQPVVRTSLVSRALAPEHAAEYRKRFAQLPAEVQSEVLQQVIEVHSREGRSTETVETLIWQTHAQPQVAARHDTAIQEARQWCRNLTARFQQDARQGGLRPADRVFAADLAARTAQDAEFVRAQSDWFDAVWAVSGIHRVPEGMSAERAFLARQRSKSLSAQSVTTYRPVLEQGGIWLAEVPVAFTSLRWIGPAWSMAEAVVTDSSGRTERLSLDGELVRVVSRAPAGHEVTLRSELGLLTWTNMERPEWATDWGRDASGFYADLMVSEVVQRLRHMEPGTFWMGSPESEAGRDSDEGPSHLVTLTEGFWLANTAGTQALWQAVVGDNPSHFKGDPNLPVDSVSWDDARRFLDKLNPVLPAGCEAVLPTEAQWEYACRAGTQTPYWFGESFSEEQAHVGQPWDKGRTVPVKARPANGWGLYQMHGNVWEWCEGSRREYKAEPVENPPDGQDRNSRALRGGSWYGGARGARSAYRSGIHRGNGHQVFGFRFSLRSIKPSQGQVKDSGGAAVKGVLRPAEPGKGASGRGARDYEDRIFPDPFPPDCATAWGDDCFGLWFEFEVGGVTQRMRWIEPEKLFLHRDEIHVPALTINHGGYWIADTPCTTKLWVAVVGGDKYTNDTNLASDQLHVPTHPDEINNQFLTKLNQMIGKNFTTKLPTKSHLDFVCNKNTSEINSAKITDVGYKEKYFLRRLDASSCGLYNLYGSINEVTRDYSDGAKWRTSKSVRSAQATFEHDEHGFLVGQPMNLHPFRFIMDVHD